jgi:3'-5' exoribonuclease
MCLSDLTDGQDFTLFCVLRAREERSRRDGGRYLKLTLGDRSGTVPAVMWDGVEAVPESCRSGSVVHVEGRFERHPRFGPEVTVTGLRLARDGEAELDALTAGPPLSVEQMEADLRDLIATVQCRHLRALLDTVFAPGSETWALYREAPAAKYFHQAYRHGLLEHSLSVAQGVSSMSATFPGIDRDVAVTGALLHDIGKLDAYTADPLAIDMTDLGKLHGEIPLGYYRVRRLIEDLPGFPARTAAAVLHIILSHHGTLEHGSPVVPCTREATLVHMIDNLGGRLGSFDRIEKELPEGADWSGFDRALSGSAWFAGRRAAA